MRTSELFAALVLAAVPLAGLIGSGCLDSGACLRNSDCPSADICSQGACVLAPSDVPDASLEGGAEGGVSEAAAPSDGSTTEAGPAREAGTDGAIDAAADGGNDAGDAGLADAPAD